jgi:hypothetical protein
MPDELVFLGTRENVKIAAKIYLKLGTIFPKIITLQEVFSKVSQTI